MKLAAEQLKALYRAFILELGGSDEEANTFAELVVLADLRGMEWQGVKALERHYIFDIQQGNIRLGQELEVLAEGPGSVAFDAHSELGQVACSQAMRAAIAKAQETGTAVATLRRSGDTGLLAGYTLMAASEDCIGLMFNNTNPYVAPWGGDEPTHGIDPLSVAVPAGAEYPIVLDMSITEAQPYFDLIERMSKPFPQPPLMRFATVREYGLSVVVEAICGSLTTMPIGRDRVLRGESAVFALAVHIPHFVDIEAFRAHVDGYVRGVKASKHADGFEEILLPGERGFREAERRVETGIPVPDDVWERTVALAERIGVDWQQALAGSRAR
jgi:LDH2 family malate/lactate/ureidoglycolate dehydrogenase